MGCNSFDLEIQQIFKDIPRPLFIISKTYQFTQYYAALTYHNNIWN